MPKRRPTPTPRKRTDAKTPRREKTPSPRRGVPFTPTARRAARGFLGHAVVDYVRKRRGRETLETYLKRAHEHLDARRRQFKKTDRAERERVQRGRTYRPPEERPIPDGKGRFYLFRGRERIGSKTYTAAQIRRRDAGRRYARRVAGLQKALGLSRREAVKLDKGVRDNAVRAVRFEKEKARRVLKSRRATPAQKRRARETLKSLNLAKARRRAESAIYDQLRELFS